MLEPITVQPPAPIVAVELFVTATLVSVASALGTAAESYTFPLE